MKLKVLSISLLLILCAVAQEPMRDSGKISRYQEIRMQLLASMAWDCGRTEGLRIAMKTKATHGHRTR